MSWTNETCKNHLFLQIAPVILQHHNTYIVNLANSGFKKKDGIQVLARSSSQQHKAVTVIPLWSKGDPVNTDGLLLLFFTASLLFNQQPTVANYSYT